MKGMFRLRVTFICSLSWCWNRKLCVFKWNGYTLDSRAIADVWTTASVARI